MADAASEIRAWPIQAAAERSLELCESLEACERRRPHIHLPLPLPSERSSAHPSVLGCSDISCAPVVALCRTHTAAHPPTPVTEDDDSLLSSAGYSPESRARIKKRVRLETILNCCALAVILLLLGRLEFGWLAFGLVVAAGINHRLRQRDAQERRDIHRIHRAANYRIREVLPRPPNWINYTDKERVLFLTNLVRVMWPFMRTSIEQTVLLAIETHFRLNKPGFLSEIVVPNVNLGMRAPVITAADVQQGDSHVILDLDMNWTAEDLEITIEARASHLKLPVKITEFQLLGTLRFMLAPIVEDAPFVKAVTFSFLNPPDINYGTLQAVFIPLSRIPKLAGFIHETISGSLLKFTWPSTMVIPLRPISAEERGVLSHRPPQGLLRVRFTRAMNLRGVDRDGKSTPYVDSSLGTQRRMCKPPKKQTTDPKWNFAAEFFVHDKDNDCLTVLVCDKNKVGASTILGRAKFEVSDFDTGRKFSRHPLTEPTVGGRSDDARPEIEMYIEYLPFIVKQEPYTPSEVNDALDPMWKSNIADAKVLVGPQKFERLSTQPSNGKLLLVVKHLWCVPRGSVKPVEVVVRFGNLHADYQGQDGQDPNRLLEYHTGLRMPTQLRQKAVASFPNSPNQLHHLMVSFEEAVCLPVGNIHVDQLEITVKGFQKTDEWGNLTPLILRYTCLVEDKLNDGSQMTIRMINNESSSWDGEPNTEIQLEIGLTLLYPQSAVVESTPAAATITPVHRASSSHLSSSRISPTERASPEDVCPRTSLLGVMSGTASRRTKSAIHSVAKLAASLRKSDGKIGSIFGLPQQHSMNRLIGVTIAAYTSVYLAGYLSGWGLLSWCVAAIALGIYGKVIMEYDTAVKVLREAPDASWARLIHDIETAYNQAPGTRGHQNLKSAGADDRHYDTLGQARVAQTLPRWVVNPAVGKVAWINEILDALWPSVTAGISNKVRAIVESKIEDLRCRMPFLKNCLLELEEFELGELPPLVDGIQHFNNQLEGVRIHLDFDLRLATNFAVSVRVGLNRVLSTSIALRNVSFDGTLRVELGPLVPIMPCFGSVAVCFVGVPTIDFDVFLGDYCVLATPFLWSSARSMLDNRIRDTLVFPHKIAHPILSEKRTQAKPQGSGILRIHLHSALGLRNADLLGKSDPVCVMVLHDEEQPQTLTSSIKMNDLNPVWDEVFEFVVANPNANFEFHVYDVDNVSMSGRDHLGSASMMFHDFPDDTPVKRIVQLTSSRKRPAGALNVTTIWKPFLNVKTGECWSHIEQQFEEGGRFATEGLGQGRTASVAVLYCFIRSVEDLDPRAAKMRGIINNQQQTILLKNAVGLVLPSLRFGLLVENPQKDKLVLELLTSSGEVLGMITASVAEFADGHVNHRHCAVDGSRGSVAILVSLRVTNPISKELTHFHHGMRAVGVLRVKVVQANGLKNVDLLSLSDPYVILSLQGSKETGRTEHINDDLNPVWNATFEFPLVSPHDTLTFTVKDHVDYAFGLKLTKEKVLGVCIQHISDLPRDTLVRREYQLRGRSSTKTAKGTLSVELEWKEYCLVTEGRAIADTSTVAEAQHTFYKTLGWTSTTLFGRLTSLAGLEFMKKPRIDIFSTVDGDRAVAGVIVIPADTSLERCSIPFVAMMPCVTATVTFVVSDIGAKSRETDLTAECSTSLHEFLGTHMASSEFRKEVSWTVLGGGETRPPRVEFVADLVVKTLGPDRLGEIGVDVDLHDVVQHHDGPRTEDAQHVTESSAAAAEVVPKTNKSAITRAVSSTLRIENSGHLKFAVLRIRGFSSAPGGTEPTIYITCRIRSSSDDSALTDTQKQRTMAIKGTNPKFDKNNVMDFTIQSPQDELIEVHAKWQGVKLGNFGSKGRLADVRIPVSEFKIGGDHTPGPDALEQEFMFESGKQSGYLVIRIIEWLPDAVLAAGMGLQTLKSLQLAGSDGARGLGASHETIETPVKRLSFRRRSRKSKKDKSSPPQPNDSQFL